MKTLLALLISSAFFTSSPVWLTDFQKAKTKAADSGKYILINFSGSDWCGPCIRLHKDVFESESFKSYAEKNLVLVNADFPRLRKNQLSAEQQKQNDKLAEKYDPDGHFPYTVLVNAKGKLLKLWDGYPNETPEQFTGDINEVISASN